MDGTAWSASGPEGCPQRYVRLWGGGSFDARTAEPAQPTQEELREAARAATPHRVADGRPAWVFDSRLEAAADGGAVEILEERWAYCSAEGLGFEFGRFVFDPWRGRRYDRGMLGLKGYYGLRIRPGRWLVRKGETSELYDPDARTLAPILAPHDVRCGTLILDDGRVTGARGGQLVLLDPETGAVTDVPLPPGTWLCDPFGRPRRTPAGRRVFHRRASRARAAPRSAATGAGTRRGSPPAAHRTACGRTRCPGTDRSPARPRRNHRPGDQRRPARPDLRVVLHRESRLLVDAPRARK